MIFLNAPLLFLHSSGSYLDSFFRSSLSDLKFSNEYSFSFLVNSDNFELLLLASYVLYYQTNIPLLSCDSVNYKLLSLVSYILFSVDSGISELFWGIAAVLLDESWVAGKSRDFSNEFKPVY